MPFEGAPPEQVPAELEMTDARLGRGTYTDDTQMAIALAESLLEVGGIDEERLGGAFLAAFDRRRGYGRGTTAVLALIAGGVPALEAAAQVFERHGSLGNGAAMRVAPVAVLYAGDPESVVRQARRSARVTHAHPVAADAAAVQAAAIAAALGAEDPLAAAQGAAETEELRRPLALASRLLGERPPPGVVAGALGNSTLGHQSVPAAIYAAAAHADLREAVTFAVRCGGDTDTIGAMAGAIAGARSGAGAIPAEWYEALEDGEKGRSHVERLADRLAALTDESGRARRSKDA